MIQSFRRLLPFLRPHARNLMLMFGFGFLVTVVAGLVPLLGQLLIEVYSKHGLRGPPDATPKWLLPYLNFTPDQYQSLANWLPAAFPILFLIYGTCRYIHYTILNITSERVVASIRMALVQKIVRLNLTYYGSLERGSGGLISRVFNDTQILQQGFNFYTDLIREPFQALIYLGIMMSLDWQLTLGSLLFLPIFLLIARNISKSLRKHGSISREAMEDLTSVLKETVDGVRVVQSFNLEPEMESRFRRVLNAYLDTAYRIVRREQAISPINEFVISLLVMCFAIYTINQVMYAGVEGAKFVTFLITAGLLQGPIKKLQDAGVKIQQSVVVTERVFSLLDNGTEVPQPVKPKPFPRDWKTIEFKNVSFAYSGETVLKNVYLKVQRGEVIALVGESGSGKSTMVNLLERFYDASSGQILIEGIPIEDIDLRELRHNIALVTQDVFLFRDSIARNIHAGDFGKTTDNVESSAKAANAHAFISSTQQGYKSSVGERGSFLSGGEKQRVSIARAIFKDAPILILDEATSALDSVSEMEVQKGLNKLMEGRTAFVIAHRLSTVFSADRILVMKKGEIVEEGTHEHLLAQKGEYYRFFQLQMDHTHRVRVGSEIV